MKNPIIFLICILWFSSIVVGCQKKELHSSEPAVMFMKNSEHSGKFEGNPISTKPELFWKFKTEGQVIASPVIYKETVYVGSTDQYFYAIDLNDSSIKWKYKTTGSIQSTAAIAHDKVFVLSYDGFLYCLNSNSGNLIWKFKTEGESKHEVKDYYTGELKPDFWDFYLSSPVVDDDVVYFGSSDFHIYALNAITGNLVWKYKTEGKIHSSPAIKNESLVIGSWDSNVYCLNSKDGKLNWKFETGKDTAQYVWLGIQGSPTIDEQRVYIGSRDAKMYGLDLITGDSLWVKDEFNRSWMPSSLAQDEQNIYTGSSDSFSFFSINKQTGAINYKTKTNAYTFSSPIIDDEMAYVGAANGKFFGIQLNTGNILWDYKTLGQQTDTIKFFNDQDELNIPRLQQLTKEITDMPTLSALFEEGFKGAGAILSSPAKSKDLIVFGACDGYVYALKNSI